MTTYTVLTRHGHVEATGCTLAEAADAVMTRDGREWEIRPDADGWTLWTSRFSRNSTLGGRPLIKSVIFSLNPDRATAEAEIFADVIMSSDRWGCDVMTEEEYAADRATVAAELAATN